MWSSIYLTYEIIWHPVLGPEFQVTIAVSVTLSFNFGSSSAGFSYSTIDSLELLFAVPSKLSSSSDSGCPIMATAAQVEHLDCLVCFL